jgi:hypothetical protein
MTSFAYTLLPLTFATLRSTSIANSLLSSTVVLAELAGKWRNVQHLLERKVIAEQNTEETPCFFRCDLKPTFAFFYLIYYALWFHYYVSTD